MKRAPIARDAYDYATFDNHGQQVWVKLPPPTLRSHGRIRRAALLIGAAIAALLLAALLYLDAMAASDAPVRGQRYRVCKMIAIDPPAWRCVWKVAR